MSDVRPHRAVEGSVQRKRAYLTALASGMSEAEAIRLAGITRQQLRGFRLYNEFRDEEVRLRSPEMVLDDYFAALKRFYGNQSRARQYARISKREMERLRSQPEFRERESDVMERLVANIEEASVRTAVGARTKMRDSVHVRWLLSHLKPERYGDKPKVIEHTYSGELTAKSVADEIRALARPGDDL